MGAIVWLPPNPKPNPDLDLNPNPNQGAIFLEGQLSGYPIYYTKEIHAKNIIFDCVVRSEHRIYLLNEKSIGREHLNVFITERFIEKLISF